MVCTSLDDDIERFELYRAVIEQQSDAPAEKDNIVEGVGSMHAGMAARVHSSMRGAHQLKVGSIEPLPFANRHVSDALFGRHYEKSKYAAPTRGFESTLGVHGNCS